MRQGREDQIHGTCHRGYRTFWPVGLPASPEHLDLKERSWSISPRFPVALTPQGSGLDLCWQDGSEWSGAWGGAGVEGMAQAGGGTPSAGGAAQAHVALSTSAVAESVVGKGV